VRLFVMARGRVSMNCAVGRGAHAWFKSEYTHRTQIANKKGSGFIPRIAKRMSVLIQEYINQSGLELDQESK
jgi:hypothetical protein